MVGMHAELFNKDMHEFFSCVQKEWVKEKEDTGSFAHRLLKQVNDYAQSRSVTHWLLDDLGYYTGLVAERHGDIAGMHFLLHFADYISLEAWTRDFPCQPIDKKHFFVGIWKTTKRFPIRR